MFASRMATSMSLRTEAMLKKTHQDLLHTCRAKVKKFTDIGKKKKLFPSAQ